MFVLCVHLSINTHAAFIRKLVAFFPPEGVQNWG